MFWLLARLAWSIFILSFLLSSRSHVSCWG
jgi:hypothetical protein